MSYILGIIGFLSALVIGLFVKNQSSSALLKNNDMKSKLNDEDRKKAKNDGQLESEEVNRNKTKGDGDSRKNQPVKPGDFN